MGNASSRPRQKTRRFDQRARSKAHRQSPRPSHRQLDDDRTCAVPLFETSRGFGGPRTATNDPLKQSTMALPRDDQRFSGAGRNFSCPSSKYQTRQSDVDRLYVSPPTNVSEVHASDATSNAWSYTMPHAPMPPGWDDRFYAGIPRKVAEEEVVQESSRQEPMETTETRKRTSYRGNRGRKRVFIDIDDPVWRGVRVNIVKTGRVYPATSRHPLSRRSMTMT